MPTTTTTLPTRTFGVEIEILGLSRQRAVRAIQAAGIDAVAEGYNHATRRHWKAVTDGSLDSGGCEVVSPVLSGEEGLTQLRTVVRALAQAGARVNRSCGLHVHLGASDLSGAELALILRRYARFEGEIDAFMAPSRRASRNTYCASVVRWAERAANLSATASWRDVARLQPGRFCKVNLECYSRQQTIEFRHHGGTCNAGKIENWVRFLLHFAEASRVATARRSRGPNIGRPRRNSMNAKMDRVLTGLQEAGMTGLRVSEIARLGGWSENSVAVYISRIRSERGAVIKKIRYTGRYRLVRMGRLSGAGAASSAPTETRRAARSVTLMAGDTLYRGVPADVRGFYQERTAEFAGSC